MFSHFRLPFLGKTGYQYKVVARTAWNLSGRKLFMVLHFIVAGSKLYCTFLIHPYYIHTFTGALRLPEPLGFTVEDVFLFLPHLYPAPDSLYRGRHDYYTYLQKKTVKSNWKYTG